MKKLNYFSFLIAVIFMSFSVTMNAQSYIPKTDAIRVVKNVIKDNNTAPAKSASVISSNEIVQQSSHDRDAQIKILKVDFGKVVLDALKGNGTVADAMAKANSVFEFTYKSRGQWDIFREVEAYYTKLLQR
ncbi:MAG TPA: hypothetical protein PK047_13425 [Saprospiraceae bacterium]|jgi:hypothetical protein|nr:hypothetical protein [Saprospiraceae bacterium]HRP43102.1 hypothetical protein [Saprospiraceae bacterium]